MRDRYKLKIWDDGCQFFFKGHKLCREDEFGKDTSTYPAVIRPLNEDYRESMILEYYKNGFIAKKVIFYWPYPIESTS